MFVGRQYATCFVLSIERLGFRAASRFLKKVCSLALTDSKKLMSSGCCGIISRCWKILVRSVLSGNVSFVICRNNCISCFFNRYFRLSLLTVVSVLLVMTFTVQTYKRSHTHTISLSLCLFSRYIRTPLIRINCHGKPSGYA